MKTKKVRFLHSLASEHFSYRFGQITEIDESLADSWIAAEICAEVPSGTFPVTCPGCGNQFSVSAPAEVPVEAKAEPKPSKTK